MYARNSPTPLPITIGTITKTSDGVVQTTGVSVKVSKDGLAWASGAGSLSIEEGEWSYLPTQTETDCQSLRIVLFKTDCYPRSITMVFTASASFGHAGTDQSKIMNTNATVVLSETTIKDVSTKTGYSLSSSGVAAIWSALVSSFTTLGSVGKLLADNLNAAVGSIPTSPLLANDARLANLNAPINLIPTNPLLANDTRLLNLDLPISTVYTAIGNLNNLSALANIYGSPSLEIPDTGSTLYALSIVIRDNEGKLVDLDALPTITASNAAGTSRSANLSSVTSPSTGRYVFTYSVSSTHLSENLRILGSGTVSGEARSVEWIGSVVNYDTLTALLSVQTTVNSINTRLPSLPAAVSDIPTANQNRDAVMNAMPNGGWVNGSFGDRWVISNSPIRAIGVTGSESGHVHVVVHGMQPNVMTASALAPDMVTEIVTGVWTRDLSPFGADTAGKSVFDIHASILTLLTRIPAATAQLVTDLAFMLVGSGTSLVRWTVQALSLAPSPQGSGTGARAVQITVLSNLAAPIQGATVRLSRAGETFTAQTNVSGVALFSLDDASWTVSITASGFSFVPTSLTVNSNINQTYSMVTESGGVIPSLPGSVTGYWTCLSQMGVAESGVTVNLKVVDFSKKQSGIALDEAVRSGVSGSDGVVQFNNLTPGVTYEVWRGSSTKRYQILVPSTATSPYALGNIIGN